MRVFGLGQVKVAIAEHAFDLISGEVEKCVQLFNSQE
jgi:hypothetical protein